MVSWLFHWRNERDTFWSIMTKGDETSDSKLVDDIRLISDYDNVFGRAVKDTSIRYQQEFLEEKRLDDNDKTLLFRVNSWKSFDTV
jgi:hypothetical protein